MNVDLRYCNDSDSDNFGPHNGLVLAFTLALKLKQIESFSVIDPPRIESDVTVKLYKKDKMAYKLKGQDSILSNFMKEIRRSS